MGAVKHVAVWVAFAGAACMQPRTGTVFAETEGRQTGLPPVVVSSRRSDPELVQLARSRLVVRVESETGLDKAEIRLTHTLTNSTRIALTDSIGRALIDTLPPGDYLGTARRVGMRQQSFRLRLDSGFADTLRIAFGWAP